MAVTKPLNHPASLRLSNSIMIRDGNCYGAKLG